MSCRISVAVRASIFFLSVFPGILNSAFLHAETPPAVIRIGLPGAPSVNGQPAAGGTGGQELIDSFTKEFSGTGTHIVWSYYVNAGPSINEAFASKTIDFAAYGDFPAVIARAGGVKIKLIVPGSRGEDSYLIVPPDSSAKSIKDLKGKRIAVNMGRPWLLAFSRLLKANNMKMSDFQIFNLVMPDGDAAVAAHRVDASYTLDGWQLQSRGLAKIIWSTREAPLDWKFSAELFGREEFARSYPETTLHIAKAYIRAAHYNSLPDHRGEYVHSRALVQHVSDQVEAQELTGVNIKQTLSPLLDPNVINHYKDVIDFALENRLIRTAFPTDELFDPEFTQQALKQLNLETYWTPLSPQGSPLSASLSAKSGK